MAEYTKLRQKLLSNADACLSFIRNDGASNNYEVILREPEGLSALHALATLLFDFGRLLQAESVLRSVLVTNKDSLELGLRAQCQKLLANVVSEQGRYDEAKSLYDTATTTLTELYGEKDPRVLAAATGFGMTYWETGNLFEAQKILQLVLSRIKESSNTLGEVGRKAASTLTLVSWHLGLMTEAEECQRRVLADIDTDKNLEIFSALEPRYIMGIIVQESGQWQAAEKIFLDMLTERVKLFGYMNRDVARTANALGRLLCFLGKYDRSRELLELAWKQQQELKLDPMNLAVLRTLFNLAVLNKEEGFYDEALDALEHAAALQLKRGEKTNS
jgi:tetratricopeptide (TPR) repeat protein